jgi:hypothetical protein
MPIVAGYT